MSSTIEQNIDFSKYGKKPVSSKIKYVTVIQIDKEKTNGGILNVRRHEISTDDAYFQLGQESTEYVYYDTTPFESWTISPDRS